MKDLSVDAETTMPLNDVMVNQTPRRRRHQTGFFRDTEYDSGGFLTVLVRFPRCSPSTPRTLFQTQHSTVLVCLSAPGSARLALHAGGSLAGSHETKKQFCRLNSWLHDYLHGLLASSEKILIHRVLNTGCVSGKESIKYLRSEIGKFENKSNMDRMQ